MAVFAGGLLKQMFKRSINRGNLQPVRFAAVLSQERSVNEIPGPTCLPFIGSSWQFMPVIGSYDLLHVDLCAEDYFKKYGSIVQEKFGSVRIIHCFEPEDFEVVAKATLHKPMKISFLAIRQYRDSHPEKYTSPGLLPGSDDRWWNLRQMSQKTVSPLRDTREFLEPTDKITKEFVDTLQSGAVIEDFMILANRLNMELICKMLFDERVHCFDDAMSPDMARLVTVVTEVGEGIGEQDRNITMWKYFKGKNYKKMESSMRLLEEFVFKMMEKVKSRGNLSENKATLAQFMSNPKIHEKELIGLMIDLLLAGIHTTAITACFLLYYVSQSDRIQTKLKKEARRLLPPGSTITNTVLNEAAYTRAVVKETLRFSPIATSLGRLLPEDLTVSGYRIPKDTFVMLEHFVACQQERHFKNAKEFHPERWIRGSPDYKEVHPYLILPFGHGLRACIARRRAEQNLFVFTLRMFSEGKVTWLRGDKLGFITPFLISPDGPVKLEFTRDV